jgi:hypothetical protein
MVSNQEEKHCLEVLLQNLQYAWDLRGEYTDSYYKAFEYVNDRPECWENGELVKDYRPLLRNILNNIKNTKVIIETQGVTVYLDEEINCISSYKEGEYILKYYKEVKNFIHNEWGITKEEIREIIKKTIEVEVRKIVEGK